MQASSNDEDPIKYPIPPFTEETAKQKVKAAQDAWNTRNPEKISLAYTPDSDWHNRDLFFKGRDEIRKFLTKKWEMELDYRLVKELWTYNGNRIAVRFEYEFHDEAGKWFRAHGNENWEFDERGYMQKRDACINNVPIEDSVRRLQGWEIHDKA
ncbi:g11841 [Coccomyxa viridis]|uniref:G11841 protein n=1 Tax=Coccomyxa viridis TaxID=1274662 RepID=A0ABP1GEJ3_9CHLO